MSDLIKREDAVNAVADYLEKLEVSRRYAKSILRDVPPVDADTTWSDCIHAIHECFDELGEQMRQASAKMALTIRNSLSHERRNGEWIEVANDVYCKVWECSICGNSYRLAPDLTPLDADMHFCSECGAKMEVHEEE